MPSSILIELHFTHNGAPDHSGSAHIRPPKLERDVLETNSKKRNPDGDRRSRVLDEIISPFLETYFQYWETPTGCVAVLLERRKELLERVIHWKKNKGRLKATVDQSRSQRPTRPKDARINQIVEQIPVRDKIHSIILTRRNGQQNFRFLMIIGIFSETLVLGIKLKTPSSLRLGSSGGIVYDGNVTMSPSPMDWVDRIFMSIAVSDSYVLWTVSTVFVISFRSLLHPSQLGGAKFSTSTTTQRRKLHTREKIPQIALCEKTCPYIKIVLIK